MSWLLGASTDFLFVEFFGPFDFLFFAPVFFTFGPFSRYPAFGFLCFCWCPFFPDDLCTANRGMGERNFPP